MTWRPASLRKRIPGLGLIKRVIERAGYEVVPSAADLPVEFLSLVNDCRDTTMCSKESLYALYEAARYVSRYDIPGDLVQCGVWRGGSARLMVSALAGVGDTERDVYLFDTYEGMTEPTAEDLHGRTGQPAEGYREAAIKEEGAWLAADLDDVRTNVAAAGYPASRLHLVKGPVEESIPDEAPDRVAVLHLDTDWYASTRHELTHLYPRLSPGGVLIIDDYGSWEGARRAVDEFLLTSNEPLLLNRVEWSCRVAVKPLR